MSPELLTRIAIERLHDLQRDAQRHRNQREASLAIVSRCFRRALATLADTPTGRCCPTGDFCGSAAS